MKTGAKGKICQALLELADGKSAQDVTVSELIARAGINRSTFYYHFTGTHEVLEYMMDDFCATMGTDDTKKVKILNHFLGKVSRK